ncbi:MAG: LAGLIDADG family homing endonuclease [Pseudomonadota bacterium]
MAATRQTEILQPASAWINTTNGPRQVADLVGTEFCHRGIGAVENHSDGFVPVGHRLALIVETRAGIDLAVQPNQTLLREVTARQKAGGGYNIDREWAAASSLAVGQTLSLERFARPSGLIDPQEAALGFLLGQMVGDGGYNPETTSGYVRFWGEHAQFQAERAAAAVRSFLDVDGRFKGPTYNAAQSTWQVATRALDRLAHGLIEPGTKTALPAIEKQSRDFVRGYLRGFFNTDGSPQGTPKKGYSVRLSQVDLSKLQAVQRMLLRLGIDASIYKNRYEASEKLMPDGKGGKKLYSTQPLHELTISRSSIMTFRRIINFGHPDKSMRLAEMTDNRKRAFYRSKFTTEVLSITQAQDVEMFACCIDPSEVIAMNGLIFGSRVSGTPHWLPGHPEARLQRAPGFRPKADRSDLRLF